MEPPAPWIFERRHHNRAAGRDDCRFSRLQIFGVKHHQRRSIAATLSAYDDLIENNSRRIKLLEEMAQRIYREWFIDFHYPGHGDIALVDSELGPMPEGWSVAALSALATITMGQSPPSSAYNRDGVGLPFHQGVGTY